MPQRCEPCQDQAIEQTFVVDCSRLLSFAVGFIIDNQHKMGSPKSIRVGRAGHGQNAGQRSPKGRTKRLTFTEGRLSFDFEEVTTRPESQAFRQVVRYADGFGLDPLASLILLCLSRVRASSPLRSACAKLVLLTSSKSPIRRKPIFDFFQRKGRIS